MIFVGAPNAGSLNALDQLVYGVKVGPTLPRYDPASPPSGTVLYLVAGDSEATSATVEVDPDSGALRISETRPGDGTVLRTSALMDERLSGEWSPRLVSPIDWSQVFFLFRDHLGLTRSQEFTDNVLFVLLESQIQPPE